MRRGKTVRTLIQNYQFVVHARKDAEQVSLHSTKKTIYPVYGQFSTKLIFITSHIKIHSIQK